MIPFPFQLDIEGRNIHGKIYSHTGVYVGGKKTKSNAKNASEKIAVRSQSGQIRTAHINYVIDPPDKCTITLFYFRHGSHFRLFQIYIHESDNFHGVSTEVLDDMIAATLRFGVVRRLWSDMLTYGIWMLTGLFAIIALFCGYYLGYAGLVSIISSALVSVFLCLLRAPLINLLGGTQRITAAMHTQLVPLCRNLISAQVKQRRRSKQSYHTM